jgi:putative acetyltransferase
MRLGGPLPVIISRRAAADLEQIATMSEAETLALRPMTEADIPAVRALHARSFAALAQAHHTQAQIAAHEAAIAAPDYADDLRRSHMMLAIARREVVATAGWLALADEPGTARIRKVFVAPALARRGLATRLVRDAEARARAAGYTRIIVRANVNAVPLYAKLGYVALRAGSMDLAPSVALPVVYMAKT